MKKIFSFIIFGLIYVSVPEFTNLIVINKLYIVFPIALIIYSLFLISGFFIIKLINKLIKNRILNNIIIILLFGFLGLLFEWNVIGNDLDSNAIQFGMFVYWVGLFMIPKILIDEKNNVSIIKDKLKKNFYLYLKIHLIITFILLFIAPTLLKIFIPILWTIVYSLFFIFYYKYIIIKENK